MQALQISGYQKKGFGSVALREVPKPQVGPHELLVRVQAAAFNPADLHIIQGEMALLALHKPPFTLGLEGVGVVEDMGSGAQGFSKGQKVFFYNGLARCGAMAQWVVLPASSCAPAPTTLSAAEGAACPLAVLCASMVLERGGVEKGQRVLVHGFGGSVGTATAALALHRGATVEATGSGIDGPYATSLGVTTFYDYRITPLEALPQGHYKMVLDTMGGNMLLGSLPLVVKGGTVVSLKTATGKEDMERMGFRIPFFFPWILPLFMAKYTKSARKAGIVLKGLATYPDGQRLAQMAQWVDATGFKPRIHKVYPLAQAKEALEAFAHGNAIGKIVVAMEG